MAAGATALSVAAPLLAGVATAPHEDAAILYTYSRNLAETGEISYVMGGERAEGATDFGWMIAIALLYNAGMPPHLSVALLNTFFLGLFHHRCRACARLNTRSPPCSSGPSIATTAFTLTLLASGCAVSGLWGFSTIAQMALLGILFLSLLFQLHDTLFVCSAVYFILLRPESIGYYLTIVVAFHLFRYLSGRVLTAHAGITALPLLVFLVYWPLRAWYFERAFPLPFYVKQLNDTGGLAYAKRCLQEFDNSYNLLSAAIVLLIAILARLPHIGDTSAVDSRRERQCGHELLPFLYPAFFAWFAVLVFQTLYLSRFRLEQNVADRFHAPLLALSASLLACFPLLYMDRLRSARSKGVSLLLLVATILAVFIHSGLGIREIARRYKECLTARASNTMYDLGLDLGELHAERGISSMWVTEAGILSYYSRIPTVDTWGLNTPEFAETPLLDPLKVVEARPDIINMHVDYARLRTDLDQRTSVVDEPQTREATPRRNRRDWAAMTQALYDGGRMLGYVMYVVPVSKHMTRNSLRHARHDLFLVNPDSPVRKEIEEVLRRNDGISISNPRDLSRYKLFECRNLW